jgi:VanZ family protein
MGKRELISRSRKWLPSVVVMAVIFSLSCIAGPTIKAFGLNKESYQINAHFFLFMILCVTYYKATKNIFYSIIMTFMYAILDETHQMFTPFRSSSLFDILVDTTGALISGGFIWKFQHILPKKLRNWLSN